MKKKEIIILGLVTLLVLFGGVFLVKHIGQETNEDIKDNHEDTVQQIEDQKYELPIVTMTEGTDKESEGKNSNNNIGSTTSLGSENNSDYILSEEKNSNDTKKEEKTDKEIESAKDDDKTISNDNTHIELPFVPAN